ncbi:hypothetical protein [Pedobacter alluvionis]|uniref:ParB/Sulfiredoxin domain-containing protein n=1 Tax=Pedobacter alluvionis TaxID=475253 RepID=A0A497XYS0_9SPHI|nr:hypothetical protein [Pedobacter alluvionis]RLJ75103.1 hypothetical protein BCL90_3451 [Pedobacter alluvionis]TFB30208.1 hypothetical protein E3V97_18745 [Pedobacter alluvionis]
MKYSPQDREDWLASIHPGYENQTFISEDVAHPSHILHSRFFTEKEVMIEYISPKKICGLEYAWGYNCPAYKSKEWRMKWIEMIHSLRRLDRVIDNFKTKSEIIAHIHGDEDPKVVMQYGDHYFTTSGQHRLCLAKFLEVDQVQVSVRKYVFNRNLFCREMRLKRFMPKLIEYRFLSKFYKENLDHDFIGLNTQKDITYIKKEYIKFLIHRYELLISNPLKGIKNELKVFFSPERTSFINNDLELYRLDRILREQIAYNRRIHCNKTQN